jgi:hypothetical protein
VSIPLKSGSLSPLEPSGPAQACNGIAIPYLELNVFSLLNWQLNAAKCFYVSHVCYELKRVWKFGGITDAGKRKGSKC